MPDRSDASSRGGTSEPDKGRRRLLKGALAAGAAVSASPRATQARGTGEAKAKTMPQIRLGPHSISRLVCGANTFNGGSHLSTFVNVEMKRYFTPEQILKTLRRCEAEGINCWQAGLGNAELYRTHREAGGTMHFVTIDAGTPADIRALKNAGCLAVAHHGEVTDGLFKSGKLERMGDYLKRVRDAGMQVGVSTHMPAVVDAVESKGWDVDYYMTCVYERHRSAAELKKLLGHVPLPPREVYLMEDPPRMYKAVRQTKRPCLAFKILAAGRLSDRKQWVERAFREAITSIKPTDGVIVGLYDRYSDQVAEDAAYVRRFSAAAR